MSWNQRGRWGCFLGKQKQRGGVARPGGRWRSSPLMGDTTLGAALGYPNPNPGQSHCPCLTPRLRCPSAHRSPLRAGTVAPAGRRAGVTAERESCHGGKREINPSSPLAAQGGAGGRGILEGSKRCQRFANGFAPAHGPFVGTAAPAKHPRPQTYFPHRPPQWGLAPSGVSAGTWGEPGG